MLVVWILVLTVTFGVGSQCINYELNMLIEFDPQFFGTLNNVVSADLFRKLFCFIFFRTLLDFMPSIPVGRIKATAVINPHNSSTAKSDLSMGEMRGQSGT